MGYSGLVASSINKNLFTLQEPNKPLANESAYKIQGGNHHHQTQPNSYAQYQISKMYNEEEMKEFGSPDSKMKEL